MDAALEQCQESRFGRFSICDFRFSIYHLWPKPGAGWSERRDARTPASTQGIPTMPESILIADDYDDNRELLRLMLETEGYHIREARNGHEALDAAREETPTVALIDLSMPSLDGWGLLREIRADERTRSIPCVAVTAFAGNQDRARALEAGFDAYISKPFRARDLIELVNSFARRDGRAGETPTGINADAPPPETSETF
jgi:two-component system cell cycle response regulator DivK